MARSSWGSRPAASTAHEADYVPVGHAAGGPARKSPLPLVQRARSAPCWPIAEPREDPAERQVRPVRPRAPRPARWRASPFDTMIASYLLDPATPGARARQPRPRSLLDYETISYEDVAGTRRRAAHAGSGRASRRVARYAGEDADVTLPISRRSSEPRLERGRRRARLPRHRDASRAGAHAHGARRHQGWTPPKLGVALRARSTCGSAGLHARDPRVWPGGSST